MCSMHPKEPYDFAQLPVESFRGSGAVYYDDAEPVIQKQWKSIIWPQIQHFNFDVTLDFAAGHGRNSSNLAKLAKKLYVVDANPDAVQFLRQRFEAEAQAQCAVSVIQNNGVDLSDVPSGTVTTLYSFDAMVHFEKRLVEAYMPEFQRVMAPGALGFIHHSNFGRISEDPDFRNHPAWRANVDKNFFAQCCFRHKLLAVRQVTIDWSVGEMPMQDLDCLSIICKPTKWPAEAAEVAASSPEAIQQVQQLANWKDERIRSLERDLNEAADRLRQQEEELKRQEVQIEDLEGESNQKAGRIRDLENSWSWRVTKPLRFLGKFLE
jgi:ubiquinone/menaquinone biosynthesis C-methylase UbiE